MELFILSLVPYSLGKNFPPDNPNDDPRSLGLTAIIAIILALSVLFFTSLIGYFWIRQAAITKGTWIVLGVSKNPIMLYFSTTSLLLSSITLHKSLQFYRKEDYSHFRFFISTTFFLAIFFVFFQIGSWIEMINQNLTPQTPNLYSFMFYFLTVLHILHVFVGLFPLTRLAYKSFGIEKNSKYENYMVVTSIYWHFLDVTWIILFGVLYFY